MSCNAIIGVAAKTHRNAFGVSAISKVGPSYCQNVRTLDDYYDRLDRDELPVMRGVVLSADDLLRRSIIGALMCHFALSIDSIEIAHLVDFKTYFAAELEALREMEASACSKLTRTGSLCCRADGFWSGRLPWSSTGICEWNRHTHVTQRSFSFFLEEVSQVILQCA